MLRLMKWAMPLVILGLCATVSYAGPVILCYESDSGATTGDYGLANTLQMGGCVNSIPGSDPLLYVASDGIVAFDPFDVGTDTSDDILLNFNWVQGASSDWTQAPDTFIWYLPNTTPRPSADEGSSEPIGNWYFARGGQWTDDEVGAYIMIDADEVTLSDVITLDNNGPGGSAEISFQSGLPEPGTLSLLGLGLVVLASRLKKRSA